MCGCGSRRVELSIDQKACFLLRHILREWVRGKKNNWYVPCTLLRRPARSEKPEKSSLKKAGERKEEGEVSSQQSLDRGTDTTSATEKVSQGHQHLLFVSGRE